MLFEKMREVAKREQEAFVLLQSSFEETLTSRTLESFKSELQETAQREQAGMVTLYMFIVVFVFKDCKIHNGLFFR